MKNDRQSAASCPACSASEASTVAAWSDWEREAAARDDGPMRIASAEASGYAARKPDFSRCLTCRSVYLHPLPDAKELAAFYQNYHRTGDFVRKAEKKVARAWRRIAFLRHRAPGKKFLEIGANIGAGAEAARRLGFSATAIEPDKEASSAGEALFSEVRHVAGMLEDLAPQEQFDFIYMAEVIEHVPDPLAFMKRVASHMAPGAILFATTPDAGHWRTPNNIMSYKSMIPPEHVVLFTQTGLRALFERAGLKQVRFRPHLKPGIRVTAVKSN
ncbi:class I SAM-dependent methyltransferase [Hyphococcus flavus]|uniref:Class I SAM-dependent methyltransferase n=1 Tax=Hyphococcus flavus TaxID=1866326 RepID=A0AAE9ZBR5_9PROT|nr:class I SAM-dependent methyltransferase [Hyphococcus flavus]WDI31809.1 class I SAM-dependent methyltransferase [Hyphococcus flavus]